MFREKRSHENFPIAGLISPTISGTTANAAGALTVTAYRALTTSLLSELMLVYLTILALLKC